MARDSTPNLTECLLGAGSSVTGTVRGRARVHDDPTIERRSPDHDPTLLHRAAAQLLDGTNDLNPLIRSEQTRRPICSTRHAAPR